MGTLFKLLTVTSLILGSFVGIGVHSPELLATALVMAGVFAFFAGVLDRLDELIEHATPSTPSAPADHWTA